jgi:hypothetical protein
MVTNLGFHIKTNMFFQKIKKWTKINVQKQKNRVRLLGIFIKTKISKIFEECSATFEECSLDSKGEAKGRALRRNQSRPCRLGNLLRCIKTIFQIN